VSVDTDRVKEYAQLVLRIRELKSEAEKLQKEADEIESELLDQFMQEGVQNIKTDSGTVFLRSQIWASYPSDDNGGRTYSETNDALRAAGLGMMVNERFNSQTLSAWVREQERDELGNPILPDELRDKLAVATKFEIAVRKAAERGK
jgi:hypothetical protein